MSTALKNAGWLRPLMLALLLALAAQLTLGLVTRVAFAFTQSNHVAFTLEGCRNNGSITLPNGSGQFICPDAAYTTGNLGKGWNELDLVPFRLIANVGNSAPSTQTYAVVVALDNSAKNNTQVVF